MEFSQKLVMLMPLTSGQRGRALLLLDTRTMTVSSSRVSFRIGDALQTSWPGVHLSDLRFDVSAPDSRICVYSAMLAYLDRIFSTRGNIPRFL